MIAVLGALLWGGCGSREVAPAPVPRPWAEAPEASRPVAADLACAGGEVEACWWLGLTRRWDHSDRLGAWAAWSRGCDHGDARCCAAAPTATARPEEPDADAVNAALWSRCDADEAQACLTLADRLGRGVGANPAPKDLGWIRNQVCDLQLDYGCAPHADWPAP